MPRNSLAFSPVDAAQNRLNVQQTSWLNGVVVVASLLGFGVTLGLVLTGWELWGIAFGIAARAVVILAGSVVFMATNLTAEVVRHCRLRRSLLAEFAVISPVTALGVLTYVVMTQSEGALVALLLGPELVPLLTLTRKAAEVARGVLDMVGQSIFGGFAHLVSSARHRSRQVYVEVWTGWLSLGVTLATAYLAINASLVSRWVGVEYYAGDVMTLLVALQMVVTSGSYLVNLLYRASGHIVEGCVALILESVLRIPLMAGLLFWLGLPGLPIASIITAIIFGVVIYRRTVQQVFPQNDHADTTPWGVWVARILLFGGGVLANFFVYEPSWMYVLLVGAGTVAIGSIVLVSIDPRIRHFNLVRKSSALAR